jgi:expansin (peptidoglycan-binding protein)
VKAIKSANRRRKRGRTWQAVPVTVAVIIAAGLVAIMALSSAPDRQAAAGSSTFSTATGSGEVSGSPAQPTAAASKSSASASASVSVSVSTQTSRSAATVTGSPTTSAAAPLAGLIKPGVNYQGVATEYAAGDGDGACSFGPAATMMIAAMNYTDYDTAKACGAYVLVHAADGASITVLITNECPAPCAPGQLDLSQQAFAKLANPTAGLIPITWQLLSPSTTSTISLRYKTGSSRYWCGIQVIGHRNPVAELEVSTSSGWLQLPRTDYNYFLSTNGDGCGNAIRITDIYGQQLTVSGIALSPNVVQPTSVQFAQSTS